MLKFSQKKEKKKTSLSGYLGRVKCDFYVGPELLFSLLAIRLALLGFTQL